ncbi:MAG: tRNA1(Val) (adenine(37)-N6)-methyltransferase [Paracoccaceae bacterium]
MTLPLDQLSHDAFLNGRITLAQPIAGYRAGVDPVLLAASVEARAGQSVLELGCGAGAALLCLGARVAGLSLHGVELQNDYAQLARSNAASNDIKAQITQADIAALPADLRNQSFDHIIANPPYFLRDSGTASPIERRETAMGEGLSLDQWVAIAARRLAPKGRFTMIQNAARMPETLAAMAAYLGSVELMPLQPRMGRPAQLILARARKGGRAAFRLHPAVLMHEGAKHMRDGESYTAQISAVLRDGAPLPWGA